MTSLAANAHHLLYVDDEEKALHYFRQMFEDQYVIHTATNAAEGYRILEAYGPQIGVLLTDQRMPGESGVELLDRARKLNPNIIRILITAFTDYQAAVKAVNEGRAFRYLHKPMDPEEIETGVDGLARPHRWIARSGTRRSRRHARAALGA